MLRQGLEQRPLAGRSTRLTGRKRGLPQGGELPGFDRGLQRSALAGEFRQRRGQGLAERMMVIVGSPTQQLQERRVEGRYGIDGAQYMLQLSGFTLRSVLQRNNHAHHLASAEGDEHTHPRLRLRFAGHGQVVENLPQRGIEGDLENQGLGGRGFFHRACG